MKLVPLEVSPELHDRILRAAGGSAVAARMLLEQAIERAMRAELDSVDARHRAKVHRQRERFGWRW